MNQIIMFSCLIYFNFFSIQQFLAKSPLFLLEEQSHQIVHDLNFNSCENPNLAESEKEIASIQLFLTITDPNCVGETGSIEITNVEGGTPPYLFALDNEDFSTTMVFSDLPLGEYLISGKDANNCETTVTVEINEPYEFLVQIQIIEPIAQIYQGNTVEMGVARSVLEVPDYSWFVNGEWVSNEEVLTLIAWDSLNIKLEAMTENGCKTSDELSLEVIVRDPVYVPNVFSPNADGINDRLIIFGREEVVNQILHFQIFDRRGDLVYEAQNFPVNSFNFGWDGTSPPNFPVSHIGWNQNRRQNFVPRVYVYVLEIELWDGTKQVIRGDVVLLR